MKTTVLMPARAPAAATALARLPVDGQANTLAPSSRAALSAQATTRSLKELVGLVESSLTHRFVDAELAAEVVRLQQPGEARARCWGWTRCRSGPAAAPCSARCWPARPRSPRGSRPGSRRRSPADRSTPDTRRTGPSSTWWPHSRQDRAVALPKAPSRSAGFSVPSSMTGALTESSSSSSPGATFAPGGIGTFPRTAPWLDAGRRRTRGGCRDFIGPYPSVPLDELDQQYAAPSQHVHIASRMLDDPRLESR